MSVIYSSTRICGLKGASVVLPCKYYYSWNHIYLRGEWYEENRGIVREHSNSDYPDCSLKIDKLADDHSGVHYFRFRTNEAWTWITGRSGVTVSVIRNDKDIQLTIYFIFFCSLWKWHSRLNPQCLLTSLLRPAGEGGCCCRETKSNWTDLQHLLQFEL